MKHRRTLLPLIIITVALCAQAQGQAMRPFSPEVALDVRSVRIAAVTDDGSRVAATVQTRRDRAGVDHQRYGDPTYISPVSTRLMVIDTGSGDQTWVHEEPAQLSGFTWSPDGTRLGYFMVEDERYDAAYLRRRHPARRRRLDAAQRQGQSRRLRRWCGRPTAPPFCSGYVPKDGRPRHALRSSH